MRDQSTRDTLQKFMFDGAPVRGELVELSDTWRQVQALREYPIAVKTLLGEMMAAAALLSANLKFNGAIIMQIYGDGPVRLLVVECDGDLQMRATAKFDADVVISEASMLPDLVNQNGNGRFVITLDPKDKLPGQQAYQGVVPLDGDSIATVIEHYMLRSEQLDTRLWLAADGHVSRGLLLQKLPSIGGIDAPIDDDLATWDRSVMLASTLRNAELLETDIETLMRRLFWEETIRVFDPQHPSFRCTCSRERVGNMLKMLGQEEVDSALVELGQMAVDCDFCGQHYEFDKVDCAQLFAVANASDVLTGDSDVKH
ncbi:Hsp33 family molecular chaperone HslO [Actimicrobium antarcticum]|uniref:Hsp33 family molecular chaperone HslO n=1 Tax=Actimicrobium antarcticum TaxID=1051899 RepID=A0ABP7SIF9_9BURK